MKQRITVALFVFVWLLSSVLGYEMDRRLASRRMEAWTVGKRNYALVCAAAGPFNLAVVAMNDLPYDWEISSW